MMDETTTLELLYREIEDSMIDTRSSEGNLSGLSNSRSSSSSRISQRTEISGVNLSELKKKFETNNDELLSPFKVKDNDLLFKKTPLKNGIKNVAKKNNVSSVANRINSLELLSGGTCVDSEKITGSHKKSPEQNGYSRLSLPILRENSSVKPFNLPNSLSLDSTKPLQQYTNGIDKIGSTVDDSQTDVDESKDDSDIDIDIESNATPKLVRSPSVISLTDSAMIDNLSNNVKLEVPQIEQNTLEIDKSLQDTTLRDKIATMNNIETTPLMDTKFSNEEVVGFKNEGTIDSSFENDTRDKKDDGILEAEASRSQKSNLIKSVSENSSVSTEDFESAKDHSCSGISSLPDSNNNESNNVSDLDISTGFGELNVTPPADMNETLKEIDNSEHDYENTEDEESIKLSDEPFCPEKVLPENIEEITEHIIEISKHSNLEQLEENVKSTQEKLIETPKNSNHSVKEENTLRIAPENKEGKDGQKEELDNAKQPIVVDEGKIHIQLQDEDTDGIKESAIEILKPNMFTNPTNGHLKETSTEDKHKVISTNITLSEVRKDEHSTNIDSNPHVEEIQLPEFPKNSSDKNGSHPTAKENDVKIIDSLETSNSNLQVQFNDSTSVIYEPLTKSYIPTEGTAKIETGRTKRDTYENVLLNNESPIVLADVDQRKVSDSSNSQFSKGDICSISTVETPILRNVSKFDSLFVDDLFGDEGDTTTDSFCKNKVIEPDSYLAIWHVQEAKQPVIEKIDLVTQNQRFVSKVMTEKVRYSFKPKVIHHPKYYYLNKNAAFDVTTSLSQDFDGAIKTLATDKPSIPSAELYRIPRKIWPETRNLSHTLDRTKSTILEDMFGPNLDSSVIKTPSKEAVVNKAISIKSVAVDLDYNESSVEKRTPIKQTRKDSRTLDGLVPRRHYSSPFKIRNKKEDLSFNVDEKEFYDEDSAQNYTMLDVDEKEDHIEVNPKEPLLKDIEINELLEEIEKGQQEFHDEGVYYLSMKKIKANITDIKRHNAKVCIHIDNGINSIQTEWKELGENGEALLDNELEIPITKDVYQLTLSLKFKYERPQNELKEVIQKVPVKKGSIFARKKYNYEKRYVRQKIEHDDWDYLFANDGTFAQLEIGLNEDFLSYTELQVQNMESRMVNRWAKLHSKYTESKPIKELPRRQPFCAGTLYYDSYFSRRVSTFESFPKTLSQAINMARKLNLQNSITKEGPMLQDGGDLNGLLENRFFILHGTKLVGYHEITMKPKIEINLLNVVDISDNTDTEPSGRNFTNLFLFGECFQLTFKDGEQMSFTCQMSGSETREWFHTIKQVIDLNVTHQPWIRKLASKL